MNQCYRCKFYTVPFLGKPTCTRISNVRHVDKKNVPFRVPVAFKICKGYFFEHSKDDLYRSLDDALSDDPHPFPFD